MTGESGYGTGSINFYANVLWAWTILSALAGAWWGATFFGYVDFDGNVTQSGIGALGGFLGGALSTLPMWALFGLGAHIARKLDRVQGTVRYEAKLASDRDAARELVAVGASASATSGATTVGEGSLESQESASPELADLLADDALRAQAARTRKIYGRKVAAEFLTRKAQEAGYDGFVVTEDDLPADL